MKESQKDAKVTTGTPSGNQNPATKPNQNNPVKSDNPSQKPSKDIKGENEMPEKEIERPSREHQHDYKTPEAKPNPSNENKVSEKKS